MRAAFLLGSLLCLVASALGRELTLKEAQADFEKADRELNAAWTFAQSKLTPAEFAALRDDQRAWLQYRDRQAAPDAGEAPAAGAPKSAEYYSTAAEISRQRAKWLRALAQPEADALTGRWGDSYGGSLLIVETAGRLYFAFEVVRGPTSHTGELAGVASWNSPIGWWSDKGLDKDKTDESNLAFRKRNRRLEVTGANTGQYHGARAYFDGDYVRLGTLTAEENAKVVQEAKTNSKP